MSAGAHEGQKMASDLLELEVTGCELPNMGTGNWTWQEQYVLSTIEPPFQPPLCLNEINLKTLTSKFFSNPHFLVTPG